MSKKEIQDLLILLSKFIAWRFPGQSMSGLLSTLLSALYMIEYQLSNYEKFYTPEGVDLEDTYFK